MCTHQINLKDEVIIQNEWMVTLTNPKCLSLMSWILIKILIYVHFDKITVKIVRQAIEFILHLFISLFYFTCFFNAKYFTITAILLVLLYLKWTPWRSAIIKKQTRAVVLNLFLLLWNQMHFIDDSTLAFLIAEDSTRILSLISFYSSNPPGLETESLKMAAIDRHTIYYQGKM